MQQAADVARTADAQGLRALTAGAGMGAAGLEHAARRQGIEWRQLAGNLG
jgi:hypothetical protein